MLWQLPLQVPWEVAFSDMKAKVISNGSILSHDYFPPPWTQLASCDSEKHSSLAQKRVCLKPPTWAGGLSLLSFPCILGRCSWPTLVLELASLPAFLPVSLHYVHLSFTWCLFNELLLWARISEYRRGQEGKGPALMELTFQGSHGQWTDRRIK